MSGIEALLLQENQSNTLKLVSSFVIAKRLRTQNEFICAEQPLLRKLRRTFHCCLFSAEIELYSEKGLAREDKSSQPRTAASL